MNKLKIFSVVFGVLFLCGCIANTKRKNAPFDNVVGFKINYPIIDDGGRFEEFYPNSY